MRRLRSSHANNVTTFEPQERIAEKLEACLGLLAGRAERALGRAPGVGLPVALLVGPTRPRAVEDRLLDLFSGVAGDGHPYGDFGVEP